MQEEKMGQTGISSLKWKKVREEGSLSPLTGTNWFKMLALKSEPGLHDLFLIPVGKKIQVAQKTLL